MATIAIKVDTNFDEASADLKKFAGVTEGETKKMTASMKKLNDVQTDKFIQKNKRIAASVHAFKGASAALATEQRGLMRKMQMLIRNGVDPMSSKLKKLRSEYDRLGAAMQKGKKRVVNWSSGLRTAAFAATGAFLAINKVLSSASNLAEQTTKFDKVFSDSTFNIAASVDELTGSYAMSTREAKQFLGSIQDLLKPMGVAPNLAAKMSTEITKLSADLGSFNNVPTAEVMRSMQAAMVGSFMPMRKFGIVMNEANIFQEAFRLGLVKTKGDMTAATKAQAAFSLIQKGSADATGDMARTADSYANSLKFMKARTEDVTAQIGQAFIPAAKFFIGIVTKIMDAFQSLSPQLRTAIIVIAALGVAIAIAAKIMIGFGVAMTTAFAGAAIITSIILITMFIINNFDKVKIFFEGFNKIIVNIFKLIWSTIKLGALLTAQVVVGVFNKVLNSVTSVFKSMRSIMADSLRASGENAAADALDKSTRISTQKLSGLSRAVLQTKKDIASAAQGIVKGAKMIVSAFSGGDDKKLQADAKKRAAIVGAGGGGKTGGGGGGKTAADALGKRFEAMMITLQTKSQQMAELKTTLNDADTELLTNHLGLQQTMKLTALMADLESKKRGAEAELLLEAAKNKAIENMTLKRNKKILSGTKQFLSDMIAATSTGGKKAFALNKALSIANATIAGAESAVSAFKAGMSIGGALAPVFAATFAAGSLFKTGKMIGDIAGQKAPSAETGGEFVVPNNRRSTRVDSQSMNVNPGETVNITPRGEEAGGNKTINLIINGRVLASVMQESFDNGQVTITDENIVSV